MKSIRYKEILFLSYQEKKARRISLDADVVVIRGGNGAGKSCLLKSLYSVFGAQFSSYPDGWNPNKILVLLKFQVDGVNYKAMKIGNDYYLYTPDNKERSRTKNREKQAEELSKIFGLNVVYPSAEFLLPVGCMFMPFYIDQETGWKQPWSSFADTGNEREKKNVMLLLTGAFTYDYYKSTNKLYALTTEYNKYKDDKETQEKFIALIQNELETEEHLDIREEDFQEEIASFVEKIQELKNNQNKILKDLQSLYYDKMFKESRITTLHESMKAIEDDFGYAMKQPDVLTCPVCGAHTKNTSLGRLAMKIDKEECRELVIQYELELDNIKKKIDKAQEKTDYLREQIEEIERIISTRKNDIKLSDYLEAQVPKKLRELFHKNAVEFNEKLEMLGELIKKEREELNNQKAKTRTDEVTNDFKDYLNGCLRELKVSHNEEKKRSLGEHYRPTGSDESKLALAYFFSYLHIMYQYGSPISAPLVIDEFKQNGLSKHGLSQLLEFVLEHKRDDVQLIFSLLDEETFDEENAKVVNLEGKHLMIAEDFVSVRKEIDDLMWKNTSMSSPE